MIASDSAALPIGLATNVCIGSNFLNTKMKISTNVGECLEAAAVMLAFMAAANLLKAGVNQPEDKLSPIPGSNTVVEINGVDHWKNLTGHLSKWSAMNHKYHNRIRRHFGLVLMLADCLDCGVETSLKTDTKSTAGFNVRNVWSFKYQQRNNNTIDIVCWFNGDTYVLPYDADGVEFHKRIRTKLKKRDSVDDMNYVLSYASQSEEQEYEVFDQEDEMADRGNDDVGQYFNSTQQRIV